MCVRQSQTTNHQRAVSKKIFKVVYKFILLKKTCFSFFQETCFSFVPAGIVPCNQSRGKLCKFITTDNKIIGANGFTHNITGQFNCKTTNIIYVITCNKCPGKAYIGETSQSLRKHSSKKLIYSQSFYLTCLQRNSQNEKIMGSA